jgi:hypothetical protein
VPLPETSPIPHYYPLFTTQAHYIEKKLHGQAKNQDFSLWDKELALEAKVNKICLKNNELREQAKAICNDATVAWGRRKKVGRENKVCDM